MQEPLVVTRLSLLNPSDSEVDISCGLLVIQAKCCRIHLPWCQVVGTTYSGLFGWCSGLPRSVSSIEPFRGIQASLSKRYVLDHSYSSINQQVINERQVGII